MMKTLTRIRLINWHYFINETISVNGSFLISGENTAGKSTVLDAIQLVLTTNHRKFNTAANEKSSRDLKGYVRCKTGNEDRAYLRRGSVITYVALEFFEEKSARYFTLGVKIDSPDEESKLVIRWFREECQLEDLSFLTGGRPSTADEFRNRETKIRLISQTSEARERFGQRLGNLEDRFFEMIPKSLAFKPMDNVKEFIYRFILAEKAIEVETLRHNIANLKELEDLMTQTKGKISVLSQILAKNEEITAKEREIGTNEILIRKAEIEAKKLEREALEQNSRLCRQQLHQGESQLTLLAGGLQNERERQTGLRIALGQNETAQLIRDTRHRMEMLVKERENARLSLDKLTRMLRVIGEALALLQQGGEIVLSREELRSLGQADGDDAAKADRLFRLKKALKGRLEHDRASSVRQKDLLERCREQRIILDEEIHNLQNKRLTYPANTVRLVAAIVREFRSQGIGSEVRIFSDLLEITDPRWQNAVEGYLNTQRFYVLVEPAHYRTALDVYNRIRHEVHTVGLVNTGKLDIHRDPAADSLAYVVKSDNIWARAYAVYLLNRVVRCDDVQSLREHKVAITPDCMLYQNFAVRKIDGEVYRVPYIGAHAYAAQLAMKQAELAALQVETAAAEDQLRQLDSSIEKLSACSLDTVEENLAAPGLFQLAEEQLRLETLELKKAENDPSYIQIQLQVEECGAKISRMQAEYDQNNIVIGGLKAQINSHQEQLRESLEVVSALENSFRLQCARDEASAALGLAKFTEQVRHKAPAVIVQNYSPLKTGLMNRKNELINELIRQQLNYCSQNDCDLGSGDAQMPSYVEEHHKLVSSDIIKYEADLEKAKENCQLEFRESFLARLKENIENARLEFKNLNAALKDIYYGEDSYRFELTANKKKESIYQMITSRRNEAGLNLWSQSFAAEYKEEMEDLFAKLTAYDDQGEKVLAEYTDYRGYLDYDIIVEKQDGTVQRFSKIYGEKSGGETQTPYYVAIAASFVQLYKLGDTIRIIIFDEAFDKMDDNRISAMMDFLNSQKFQIILATPPAKIEVIGEKVDTILMAMREGTTSIIEEFDL